MTSTTFTGNAQSKKIQDFFTTTPPFAQLPDQAIADLTEQAQFVRYRMGQTVLMREQMPAQITVIYTGQIRLLGYDPQTKMPITLRLLEIGELVGWAGVLRGKSCETAIASVDTVCLQIPIAFFQKMVAKHTQLEAAYVYTAQLIEVYDLLGQVLQEKANSDALMSACGASDLKELATMLTPIAIVRNLAPGKSPMKDLDANRTWLVSSGVIAGYEVGKNITPREEDSGQDIVVSKPDIARLVGVPVLEEAELSGDLTSTFYNPTAFSPTGLGIPYAPDQPIAGDLGPVESVRGSRGKLPFVSGRGVHDSTMACFKMLAKYFRLTFKQDTINRILTNQLRNGSSLSLQTCGAIAEMQGMNAQMIRIPTESIGKLTVPILIPWEDSFAIIYEVSEKEYTLAIPAVGIRRYKPSTFSDMWGSSGEILLIKPPKATSTEKFGLSWFIPAVKKHRKVLIEVLVASLFVQLFGLANPLMTQLIIDKVLMQNSPATLNTFGALLIAMAIVEAILTALRTNLFVDTTNRIDLSLGSEIIDHLLRLPLSYYEKRPVGELATRINELENIRQFLTGTALTVVLDAIFSVVYIVVMLYYSPLLTLVALATLPAFAILTWIVSPIVRKQLRVKAERNAETQSYLVEVVGGIQTIKAQNIELRTRWQWQQRYARYVSAGFKTATTSTNAGAISGFLNKFSSLLLLWVGAYLVLDNKLTLGQLIAFRIIAGYTTQPLLRLVQLWQSFQETALSLERLGDIIDTPQEVTEEDLNNIPLPLIEGAVKFENLNFSFPGSPALQLNNVNLAFEPGQFVGIVGLSGSGKSTLMKLVPRLYAPKSGRILIDGYDINKVELYSLRRQVGVVLQDTLLFNGTIQENIALTNPEATSEQIIEAAKIAAAHEFIMGLPSGYNTKVGERGSALSGGQRQRVAIARTVLQNPQLLILDEATSALDYDSERQVCVNLAAAFEGKTVFFITHRLSTIRSADVIVMMDKGLVVEQGTHNDLMALKGRYYCLYQQQEFQA
jgi:HlyB family type I secretion system ABC transporter